MCSPLRGKGIGAAFTGGPGISFQGILAEKDGFAQGEVFKSPICCVLYPV